MSFVDVRVIIATLEARKLSLREKLAQGFTARPGAAPNPTFIPALPTLGRHSLRMFLSPPLDCEPQEGRAETVLVTTVCAFCHPVQDMHRARAQ